MDALKRTRPPGAPLIIKFRLCYWLFCYELTVATIIDMTPRSHLVQDNNQVNYRKSTDRGEEFLIP